MRAYAGTDVALMNGGGIRTDAVYPAGPITRKAIIAFLPFGNALVSVKITGAALKAALENGVSQVEAGAGRFPQVSGLRFTWSRHRPVGARILTVTINGQPLSATQIYTVATNDYMLGGGDGYTALAGGQVIITPNGGPLLATVVLDAVHKAGAIAPSTDGRITEMQ
jgi:2',3'-cyclic-nucleotide 2'-phosphodiesterase (5'-nucleotidase family)